MNVSRNVLLSCEILAAHKLRTSLSVIGVIVGIGAVVVMFSAGRGAEERILSRIRDMGTNLIVVNAGQTRIVAGRQRQLATVTTLEPDDADAIAEACPSVARAAAAISKKLSARWTSENTNTNVLAMTPEGFGIRAVDVAAGRTFTAEENRARRRVAVLGPTVVANLFGRTDPLGQSFRIGRIPFKVIGVTVAKGLDVNGMDQDDLIIVPLATGMRRLVNVTHVDMVYVQARSAADLGAAEEEIRALLRRRHRLRDKPDDFTVQNQATLLATERQIARATTLLIGSVAGISLLVGGVGILAVMLISVRERRREIGLRRAVGAVRRDIRNQFLIESGLLATAGGLFGVAAGVITAHAVSWLGYWPAIVSWPVAGAALAFSVMVGLVFGVYPAQRAARLEPIQALRAE